MKISLLYSPYYEIFKRYNLIIIEICNKYAKLRARCPYARANNKPICEQEYHHSRIWAINDLSTVKIVVVPSLNVQYCKHKNNISYLYGWSNDSERLVLGEGDFIKPDFNSGLPWKTPKKIAENIFHEFHFSDIYYKIYGILY